MGENGQPIRMKYFCSPRKQSLPVILIVAALTATIPFPAVADPPASPEAAQNSASLTGAQIATHALSHDAFAFEGASVKARMILTNADGQRQERSFNAISKKDGNLA